MHIVHCLTHSDIGGGQATTFTLVKQLRQHYPDIYFTVLLPAAGIYTGLFRNLPCHVIEFPFNKLSVTQLIRSKSLFEVLKPDIIHSHGKGAGMYSRFWRMQNVKQVHTYHAFQVPSSLLSSTLYIRLESYLLGNTDTVIAVSPSEGDEIQKTFSSARHKLRIMPNVVNCADTTMESEKPLPREAEEFFSKNNDSFIVTMIARDDPVKNYGLACAAARIMLKRNSAFAFAFVGADFGNSGIMALKKEFPQRFAAFGVIDSPAAITKRGSAMLLTSRKEGGLPLVLQEAFCFGKPVVGTNVAGIKDLVVHGANGLLCDETEESIASTLQELHSDKALYARLRSGAFSTAAKLDISAWAKNYFDLYSNLRG